MLRNAANLGDKGSSNRMDQALDLIHPYYILVYNGSQSGSCRLSILLPNRIAATSLTTSIVRWMES